MKKLLPLLLLLLLLGSPALAEWVTLITPAPTAVPQLVLRPSSDEVKVYAAPNMKAGIVGYIIVGGRQDVELLSIEGEWVYVAFSSIYGTSRGYIPLGCFEPAATPTPTPSPTPSLNQHSSAFVRNPQAGHRLNLRLSPSTSAASLGKYYTGTPVTLTGEAQGDFLRVLVGTVSGWMDARYLTADGYSFLSELPQVWVKNPDRGANLRRGPSTSAQQIGWYAHGTPVTVLGVREDEWYHVALAGQTGYMSSTLLSETFPWQYGADSDNPAVSDSLPGSGSVMYLNNGYLGSVHLRQSAAASARSLGSFYTGCPLTVVSYTRTGWCYVRIGSIEGYLDITCLSTVKPSSTGRSCIINNPYGTGLNLRTLPSTSSAVLTLCPNFTAVTVLAELPDDWCYVVVNGQYGYMLGTRLTNR